MNRWKAQCLENGHAEFGGRLPGKGPDAGTSPGSPPYSGCGSVKAKLTLAERVYQCDACGLVMGRDVNAARNLPSLAASGADRVNACRAAVRPGLTAGRAALKQEPGTANAGQTGTAAPQAAAA
jgi:putative transposase